MKAPRILVAGAGNLFLGDDGFGPAVAAQLGREPLPEGVVVRDYGIRGLHLAYELLDPPQLLIVVDALSRGQEPGTLFVVEREGAEAAGPGPGGRSPRHDLARRVRRRGGAGGDVAARAHRGLRAAALDEAIGLSAPVAQAVESAAHLVRRLVERELATGPAAVPASVPGAVPRGDHP